MTRSSRKRGKRSKNRKMRIIRGDCLRQKNHKQNEEQKMMVWKKSEIARQGGHQGAVGRVKCGEG